MKIKKTIFEPEGGEGIKDTKMNLTCPLCHSEAITDDSDYLYYDDTMKIKREDNHYCNKCGVVFKDVRK